VIQVFDGAVAKDQLVEIGMLSPQFHTEYNKSREDYKLSCMLSKGWRKIEVEKEYFVYDD